jgi:excinuclease ABC subunit C
MRMGMIHMQQELERKGSLALQLQKLFELSEPIHSIDCFDISHKQGTAMVGACIRFIDGKPAPDYFRKFEIKTVVGQDDYASLREVVMRRYRSKDELPDLVLIDGGKGQLSAVAGLIEGGEFASLAKREETIFSSRFPAGKVLKQELYVSQVLIALRDYTHHFAISYHRAKERIEKAL